MYTWSELGIDVLDSATGHKYILCPACSEERKKKRLKTLGVTFDAKSFACAHCGFSGSLYKGILNKGDLDKPKGVKQVKKEFRKPVFTPRAQESKYPPKFLEIFSARMISEEVLWKNKVSPGKTKFSSSENPEEEQSCILFPFYKNGEVVNIKYRGLNKEFKQSYEAEKVVYGYDNIKGKKEIIFVEGEIDKLSWNTIGLWNVCSVPDGAPNPETKDYTTKFDFLESIVEDLEKAERIILAVDADAAGEKLKEELARRIGKEKCFIVDYPNGRKDSNDVLRYEGKEALLNVYKTCKSYPISGIFTLLDVQDEIDFRFEHGITPGYSTPWDSLTDIYRIGLGEYTTVTGIPGSGKSEVIDSICLHLALFYKLRIGVFSPEHPMWVHIFRLAEKLVNKPIKINIQSGQPDLFENSTKYMTVDEYFQAKKFINEHFFWIKRDRKEQLTLDVLQEKKKALILRHGCSIFIDDPYNKMDHARPTSLSETEYISQFLDKYAEFNEDHNSHSFLVAHPTKLKKEKVKVPVEVPNGQGGTKKVMEEVEQYPVATAYDISGSANWWNKSYNVLSGWREGMIYGTDKGADKPLHLYTQKIKFKWNGKLGKAKLFFNSKTGNYHESLGDTTVQRPQENSSSDSNGDLPF